MIVQEIKRSRIEALLDKVFKRLTNQLAPATDMTLTNQQLPARLATQLQRIAMHVLAPLIKRNRQDMVGIRGLTG
jgi:hypothetical protein